MNITGGKYNSLNIETAKFDNVKPTLSKVRQAVFNSLATQGDFETFCDLFAGSGIMTFEAISRGFEVTSVEIDKKTAIFIKKNAEKHKIPINLINYDGIKFLQKQRKHLTFSTSTHHTNQTCTTKLSSKSKTEIY